MRRIMLAVAIGLLGLPGCGTDPPTPPPLTPSPSATPSAPTAPELPPEAQGSSRKAAKAFVEYYVAVMSYAVRTGDTSLLQRASSSKCESCSTMLESIKETYRQGGSVEGEGYSIQTPNPHLQGPGVWVVDGLLVTHPQSVVPRKGVTAEAFPESEMATSFLLQRDSDGWRVLEWQRVERQ